MKTQKNNIENQKGFTLVELAVVSVIAGVLLVGFGALVNVQLKRQEVVSQDEIMKDSLKALARYVHRNGRYPCPADPALGPNDPNYGVSLAEYPGATGCDVTGTSVRSVTNPDVAGPDNVVLIGAFPFQTLTATDVGGAGDSINGLDVYKNKLTYAVSLNLAKQAESDPPLDIVDEFGAIQIGDVGYDAVNDVALPPTIITDRAHFALLSHGADREGAYTRMGTPSGRTPTGIDGGNSVFTVGAGFSLSSFSKGSNAGDYDDFLIYRIPECDPNLGDSLGDGCLFGKNDEGIDLDGPDLPGGMETTMSMKSNGNFGVGTETPLDFGPGVPAIDGNIDIAGETKIRWEGDKDCTIAGSAGCEDSTESARDCTQNNEGALRYNFSTDIEDRFLEYCAFIGNVVGYGPDGENNTDDDDGYVWTRIDERRDCFGEDVDVQAFDICRFGNTNLVNPSIFQEDGPIGEICKSISAALEPFFEATEAATETMFNLQTLGSLQRNGETRDNNLILQAPNVMVDMFRGGVLIPVPIPFSGIASYKLYRNEAVLDEILQTEEKFSLPGREGVFGLGAPNSLLGNVLNLVEFDITDAGIGVAFYQPIRLLPAMDHMEIAILKDTFCAAGLAGFDKTSLFDEPLVEEKTVYQCVDGRIKEVARWHSLIHGDCPVDVPW